MFGNLNGGLGPSSRVRALWSCPSDTRQMGSEREPNGRLPSNTFGWRYVKISRAPQASDTARRRRSAWWSRPERNPREPLTLTVKYRGGPECWYEIHARGCTGRFPGHVTIHDIMTVINRTK